MHLEILEHFIYCIFLYNFFLMVYSFILCVIIIAGSSVHAPWTCRSPQGAVDVEFSGIRVGGVGESADVGAKNRIRILWKNNS